MINEQHIENINNSILAVLDKFRKQEERSDLVDARQELTRLLEIVKIVNSLRTNKKLELLEIGIGLSYITSALRSVFSGDELAIDAVEHPNVPLLSNDAFKSYLAQTQVSLKPVDICSQPLPYDDSLFDVVVFSETIEHISPTIVPAILKEISRVLRQDGIVIISSPNLAAWQNRWRLMRGKSFFDEALPLEGAGGTYAHIRLYTANEIASLLKHFGMKTIGVKYLKFGINNQPPLKKTIYNFIYRACPSLAPDLIMYAKKV